MGLGGVPNVSSKISGNCMASVDRDVAGDDQDALGVVLWEAIPSDLSVSKVVLETNQMPPFSRMLWIDHLRMFVILLLFNMRACVTCSHVGVRMDLINEE